MRTERDLELLDQAVRLIIKVIERAHIEAEDKSQRVRDIREGLTLTVNKGKDE